MSKTYRMCADQPAQIDCRIDDCVYHKNARCISVSPAITINKSKRFVCWSYEEKEKPTKNDCENCNSPSKCVILIFCAGKEPVYMCTDCGFIQ